MKSFLNFTGSLSIERNDVSINLVPVTLEKGSKGVYPGLSLKDFDIEVFQTWQCKNKETANDDSLRINSFNTKLVELFNELVFLPAWKSVVDSTTKEYEPSKKEKKPDITVDDETRQAFEKAFTDSVTDFFNLVTRSKEKDSVYYRNEAMRLAKLASKEENKEAKAKLKLEGKQALELSKKLEEQEKAQADSIFDEIFGEDDNKDNKDNNEVKKG